MSLTVRILTSADPGGPAVVLSGELDLTAADGVTAALDQVAAERPDRVVVDAEGVTFCDSSGLRSLLAAPGPNPVVLRSPSARLLRVLEMTGLTDRFETI
jgi:anti-sigma B factor antagonist